MSGVMADGQLILSSGINANQQGLDADGIGERLCRQRDRFALISDRHFGVNALGHYYAINQLYPLLRKTS